MYKNFVLSFAFPENDNSDQELIDGDISQTLTKYATDADVETRQEFARALCCILRQRPLEEILNHIHDIIAAIFSISEDKVASVRTSLVELIPYIFLQCHEHASLDLENFLYDRLLQIVLDYLQDEECEVRREAYSVLQSLLEKYAIDKLRIEEKVCPAIICPKHKIHYESLVQFNIYAITLMGKIAPIIGPQKTEELFLKHFIDLCNCKVNSVRRTCAAIFPIICYILGTKITEEKLLDPFFSLCEDIFWGVRKACAETVPLVSLVCTPETRKSKIAPVVLKLANDSSKWVLGATFKILGQFIASFAEPCITGLNYLYNGELHITNPVDDDFRELSDLKLVANYEHYLKSFANIEESDKNDEDLNGTENKVTEDLTADEIAQLISDSKNKLVKQINEAACIKRSIYKNADIWGDSWSNYLDNKKIYDNQNQSTDNLLNSSLVFSNSNNDENTEKSLNISSFSEGPPPTNSLKFINSTIDSATSITSENAFNNQKNCLTEISDSNSEDNNFTGDISNNMNQNSNISDTKGRRRSGLLVQAPGFWRKNTPSDLSSIIKKAITEVNQDNKPKLQKLNNFDQTSGDGLQTASCDSKMAQMNIELSKMFENLQTNKSRYSDEKDLFPDKNNDNNNASSCSSDIENDLSYFQRLIDSDENETVFQEYNSHKYWQIDPELPLDPKIVEQQYNDSKWMDYSNKNCDYFYKSQNDDITDIVTSANSTSRFKPPTDYEQNIVPSGILESYVTMVLYEDDEEIKLNCAYNFPAVTLTIGRSNWHILKSLLQYLCDDIDWKVRKTIALSIDVLAMILGKEIATKDLVPIFLGFFKDLDEVKIEAIRNLAKFLKAINQQKHEEILSNIGICLRVDSKTNWRIKEDLAKQICLLIKMYNSINNQDSLLYLTSLTGFFLEDKVSCVREIAAEAMSEIIQISKEKEREAIIKYFLVEEFVKSNSWRKRQIFLTIFYKLIKCGQPLNLLPLVISSIQRLSHDSVPNIRLLVAKNLVQLIQINGKLLEENSDSLSNDIIQMVKKLREDEDRDVREIFDTVDYLKSEQDDTIISNDDVTEHDRAESLNKTENNSIENQINISSSEEEYKTTIYCEGINSSEDYNNTSNIVVYPVQNEINSREIEESSIINENKIESDLVNVNQDIIYDITIHHSDQNYNSNSEEERT